MVGAEHPGKLERFKEKMSHAKAKISKKIHGHKDGDE